MGMRETYDGLIGRVISSAPIPPSGAVIGAELNKSVRERCSRECMSVVVGANHRVNPLGNILFVAATDRDDSHDYKSG